MKVIKRDGREVDYDRQKIITAIQKANILSTSGGTLLNLFKIKGSCIMLLLSARLLSRAGA